MKRIYFRILAICISLVLTFSILYKDSIQAEALEWVGVAVGYDTALKFLLGLLGVSVGVGVAQEVDWGTLRQDCSQVMIDQGASQVEVSNWWSKVIHGSIDTASSCWASFKDWASSLISPESSSGSFSTPQEICEYVNNNFGSSFNYNGSISSASAFSLSLMNDRIIELRIFSGGSNFRIERYGSNFRLYSDSVFSLIYSGLNNDLYTVDNYGNHVDYTRSQFNRVLYYNISVSSDLTIFEEISSEELESGIFDGAYENIGDIALNPENADTLATDVIPLPWENIGASDTDIEGIIDDAISRVIDGTLSLENYWEYVQNITNTYAYSIENNYLLPNENGEDKKADDKVKENVENGAFVLYGLEKVFPFCIPFDIYAFITLLKADPVAPVIEYPIYNPVTQENEIITIDFSEWESVVIIFRYIFDFLLIIGLLLLARPLVGAGGDS